MKVMFPVIFLSLFFIMYAYIYYRLIKRLHFKKIIKKSILIFLLSTYIGVACYMLSRYYIDVPNSLYYLFSLSIGIGFVLFVTTIIYEFLSLVSKITNDESRRWFFKKSIDYVALIGGVSYASGATIEGNAKPIIENIELTIKNLKKDTTIVQISDIHIGGLIDKDFVKNLVKTINDLKPDTIVITGDLIDTDIDKVKDVVDELKNLSSKNGTFFIVGNHEYFHDIYKILEYLKSIDIKLLINSNHIVDNNFNLIGVTDLFGDRIDMLKPSLEKAKNGIDNELSNILLSHQPKFISKNDISDMDLILCGHTHGGQIFPFSLLVKLEQPYLKGLHKKDNTYIYVNRGTGFWGPPMRLGSSSEITHISLKKG